MELFQLRYFASVAKYENFSKAADELLVTQPSVSKAISSLEKELGVSLFDRKGKKIVLNDAGRLLQSRISDVMPVFENLPNELRSVSGDDSSIVFLRVLAMHEAVAAMLIRFKRENPYVNFRLVSERNSPKYDLCFSSALQGENINNGTLVLREEIKLAVPDTSKLAGAESVNLCGLRNERFVAVKHDAAGDGGFSHFFELCGYRPKVACYCDNPNVTRDLIAAGVGVSLWPVAAWGDTPGIGVSLIRINNPVCRRSVFITWPESGIRNCNVRKFLDFARNYLKRLS